MSLYAIYIGREAEPNLEIGINTETWGFKRKPREFENLRIRDKVLLGYHAIWEDIWGDRPKGFPRTKEGKFRAKINIIEVEITSPPYEDYATKIWEGDNFPYRFKFKLIKKYDGVIISPENYPTLSEAFRYSSTTYGWVEPVKSVEWINQTEDIAISEENDQEGWVYALSHPKWPNWIKIGCTINEKARLNTYHTSVPDRLHDYVSKIRVNLAYECEQIILVHLRNYCEENRINHSHEWFELSFDADTLSLTADKLGILQI